MGTGRVFRRNGHVYNERAVFEPQAYVNYRRRRGAFGSVVPRFGAIVFLDDTFFGQVLARHETTPVMDEDPVFYLLDELDGDVGLVGGIGVGAPAAVRAVEQLIAGGIRSFVSIGPACSIDPSVAIGDLMVCDRAIRDEGTSMHYLPEHKAVRASGRLTQQVGLALAQMAIRFRRGASWSTDAPFRETPSEIAACRAAGALTVDMAASALFALGAYRQAEIAASFLICESVAGLSWDPGAEEAEKREAALEDLFLAAAQALVFSV